MVESQGQTVSVSLHSVRKSGRVLYALSQFYLPFYNCDLRTLLFDHYEVFGCLSAGIYDVDEMIEGGVTKDDAFQRLAMLFDYLNAQLECDDFIRDRFEDARRYYAFEEQLLRGTAVYTFDDLANISAIRSFDFRIMHRALTQLIGIEPDARTFSWFRWFEMLMEVEDDLLSATEDRNRGTYNILSLATRLSLEDGIRFVEEFRHQIERNLHAFSLSFSHETEKASSILVRYRMIVPRPDLSSVVEEIVNFNATENSN